MGTIIVPGRSLSPAKRRAVAHNSTCAHSPDSGCDLHQLCLYLLQMLQVHVYTLSRCSHAASHRQIKEDLNIVSLPLEYRGFRKQTASSKLYGALSVPSAKRCAVTLLMRQMTNL